MLQRFFRNTARLSWLVVVLVGLLVLGIVLGLKLFGRLDAGQDVLDDAAPAFTEERVEGSRAGITIVSQIVDLSDPIVLESGGAAAEVPALLRFISQETGLSPDEVLATLDQSFPHTTALLEAIPLEAVNAEIPGLVEFLSENLGIGPDEVLATLEEDFPRLSQSIANLDPVVNGWGDVPSTEAFTNFAGEPVQTVPEVRDYFADDLIPVLERQQSNFEELDSNGGIGYIPALLSVLAIVVILFGLVMMFLSRRGDLSRRVGTFGWSVVTAVGVLVIVIVLVLGLFPRLEGGNDLIEDARPAFTEERVEGSRAGITIVSQIVDLSDPIVLESGGAAAEVPALLRFISQETGLSPDEVLATLDQSFPHTTALLEAIPLEAVNAEIPGLVEFLSENLGIGPDEVLATLEEDFPRLSQSIANLDPVVNGWGDVPSTEAFTNFAGEPVQTVPEVRDYFADDLIPVLERQQSNFEELDTTPPVDFFPPLLVLVGLLVVVYGVAMLVVTRRREPDLDPYPSIPVFVAEREHPREQVPAG